MDILLLDALVPGATAWLEKHHRVHFRPELVGNLAGLKQAGRQTVGIVVPMQTAVTSTLLNCLPNLKVLGRLHAGTDNLDLDACTTRGITVVHVSSTSGQSNAEFLLTALLLLYRRGMVSALLGNRYATMRLGRELYGSTVGIFGLAPAARTLASMLTALGAQLIGYDPAVHHSAPVWDELGIQPVTLPDMLRTADAVSVQMLYAQRFKGFFSARTLSHCRPGQIWVSISRSEIFDRAALADALGDGRIEACVIDSMEVDFLGPASPLRGVKNLTVTPRLSSHTHEARLQSSWHVAHRMQEALMPKSLLSARLVEHAVWPDVLDVPEDVLHNSLPDRTPGVTPDLSTYLRSGVWSALGHVV